jgi:hypothetical protein
MASEQTSTTEIFDVTELVGLFREALLALLPVMERSRIRWREGQSYDPWENIERMLYESIIGSCVENAMPIGSIKRLASYGLVQPAYTDQSFLVSSDNKNAAFQKLVTRSELFDEAAFVELRVDLTPSKNSFHRALAGTHFLLATPKDGGRLEFHQQINYLV